jgi:hypothetical protein
LVLHTTYVIRVPYSCGVVLVFWFWREIGVGVMFVLSVQYSCAVVSVFCCGKKANLVQIFLSNLQNFLLLHFGFFILEKQLASQNIFLVRSELSITAYLLLVFYRTTSLQSLSFLKNIEILCR